MADRSIVTRIRAEATQFLSTMDKVKKATSDVGTTAEKATRQTDSAFGKMSRSFKDNQDQWDRVGNSALIAGGAMAAGLGLATKAAIDWESAFAGVRKTVDDTEQGYAALEQELRDLAEVLPASQAEIAGVAEAAGQLGVQRENITEFTRVMIDLGESTNLSAEEAATGLARFANVMGTSLADVDRLGSVIVGLGNNFATTEREILEMSSRLSGAGRQANLTEGDVMGIATALSSVGIEAEAGGTAFSRVMIEIGKSVDTGAESLSTFASVAGMTTAQFQALWQRDAGEGLQRFIAGLGELQARGESLEPVLEELGFTDIRVGDALRRSAASSDVFTRAMAQGNEEWEKNNALTEEAAKRYETAEAQLAMARNQITNAAIDAGTVLAPVLVDIANLIAGAASAFADLPKPIQEGSVWLAALGSAALLAFGGAVKAASGAAQLHEAMTKLSASSPAAASGLGKVGKAATGAFVLTGVAVAIDQISDAFARNAVKDVEDLAGALSDLSAEAAVVPSFGDLFENQNALPLFRKDIETAEDALAAFADQAERALAGSWADRLERFLGNGSLAKFEEQVSQIDAALADLAVNGSPDQARRAFEMLTEAAVAQGVPLEELTEMFPQYAAAAAAAEDASTDMASGVQQIEQTADEAQTAIDELANSLRDFGAQTVDARQAEAEFFEAVRQATEAVEENGATLDLSTEAGKANNDALTDLRAATLDQAAATLSLTGSIEQAAEKVEIGRQAFIDAATQMGLTQAEAEDLADSYGLIPEDVITYVEARGTETAKSAINGVIQTLNRLTNKTVTIRTVYQSVGTPGALSTSTIGGATRADGGIDEFRNGRHVQAMANGGMFDTSLGAMRPGVYPVTKRGILMAEDGAGPWEAFISGHPQKKHRSRAIADETVARLGGEIVWRKFADGGIFGAAAVAGAASPAARDVQVNIPVQTVERADPVAIGAQVAWQVGGLP